MNLPNFLNQLQVDPTSIAFNDTIAVIDSTYNFTPTAFKNGEVQNQAGENNGSCKIFAFGLLNTLTEQQTLACFGDYYRKDVLENPENDDHQNIRNFITHGWTGVQFGGDALLLKN